MYVQCVSPNLYRVVKDKSRSSLSLSVLIACIILELGTQKLHEQQQESIYIVNKPTKETSIFHSRLF